jgi:5-dehydro-4-deoxyglucarate dehydratase
MNFDGVLFFPVTPFAEDGTVDVALLKEHITSRLPFGPGGVFPACGTGEFHALSLDEIRTVVTAAVEAVAGAVPVVSGAGGPLGHAIAAAKAAEEAGADALLVLPPYLVTGPTDGVVAYVEAIAAASSLPVIVYHRGTARFTAEAITRLTANPKVVGFKDGIGDVGLAQEIVSAINASGLLEGFYAPLVRLRDQTPGFGVSLIKAGLRLAGLPVGPVRPPLVDPSEEQLLELKSILAKGHELAGS